MVLSTRTSIRWHPLVPLADSFETAGKLAVYRRQRISATHALDPGGRPPVCRPEYAPSDDARLAELADAADLGSAAERRGGSSPSPGTTCGYASGPNSRR